jgi:uncharacterized membrane protein HdeD (DUF308 family)
MEALKKLKSSAYSVSIVYIIVGIIMLLNPSFIGSAVNYILGVLVIIYGLIYSITVYQKKEGVYDKFDLLAGVICISFGIFLIINKDVLLSLIPFCMGIIILMDAITGIIRSLRLKKTGLTRWYIILIINLIFLGFAVYIIVNANAITELLIRFIGGFLIVDAIMDFFLSIRFSKRNENVETREITVIEEKND